MQWVHISSRSFIFLNWTLQINKSIAELLARNRARNDASNRAEFLHTHRRLHTNETSDALPTDEGDEVESASCARTDARTVDRDVMMKFDIAKNEEGPLRRTLKVETKNGDNRLTDKITEGDQSVTADRHPGLDERLKNLETHLAMRYGKFACFSIMPNLMAYAEVPSPPATLLHRIKFVEDHIMQLEREYPPWAALHFNQPRRGVSFMSCLLMWGLLATSHCSLAVASTTTPDASHRPLTPYV